MPPVIIDKKFGTEVEPAFRRGTFRPVIREPIRTLRPIVDLRLDGILKRRWGWRHALVFFLMGGCVGLVLWIVVSTVDHGGLLPGYQGGVDRAIRRAVRPECLVPTSWMDADGRSHGKMAVHPAPTPGDPR